MRKNCIRFARSRAQAGCACGASPGWMDRIPAVGAWTAEFRDDYFRLIRRTAMARTKQRSVFERTQPGSPMLLIMVGNGIKTVRGAIRSATASSRRGLRQIALCPVANQRGPAVPNFEPVTLKPFAFTRELRPAPYNREAEQEQARGITGLALTDGLTDAVRFEMGSLRAPIATMQACADDLLKVWGLDVDKHKALSTPVMPIPAPGGVLPQNTIPFTEFGKFGGGANQVRVIVSAEGKPTACTIYSPSLSESLNQRICGLIMEKATFAPAKDSSGQAMASYWMGTPMAFGAPFGGRGG